MHHAAIGSMTAPKGADAPQLQAANQRLLACTRPDPENPRRVPLPLLPAKRAAALHKLAAQRLQANTQLAAGLARWAVLAPFDPRGAAEAAALGMAFWQQCLGLQAQWADGLAELAEEAGELREANTLTHAVAQEVNLMQQAFALANAQAGLSLQLLENAQNNFAFWLEKRVGPGGG